MIKNEQQATVAQQRVDSLHEALSSTSDDVAKISLTSLLDDVQGELSTYIAIRDGHRTVFSIADLDELGDAMVKARLARHLTQAELADRVGVSAQMVQKDERSGYESAAVTRLADICDALDYEFSGCLRPKHSLGTVRTEQPFTDAQWQPFGRGVNVILEIPHVRHEPSAERR